MKCYRCLQEKREADFVNGSAECYKCVWERKCPTHSLQKNKRTEESEKVCRTCGVDISLPRIRFCSAECQYEEVLLRSKRKRNSYTARCSAQLMSPASYVPFKDDDPY